MSGPAWLSWLFAVLMIASATFHAGRLVAAAQAHRRHPYALDLTHLVMSTAMAAMLVRPLGAGQATLWSLLIAVPAAWFAVRTLGPALAGGVRALGHPAQQLVMAAAMLYMLALAGGPTAHPATDAAGEHPAGMPMADMAGMDMEHATGHGTATSPAVAVGSLTLVVLLAVVSVGLARQVRPSPPAGGSPGWLLGRRPSVGAQLAMTSAMGYMLVLMAG